MRNRLVGALVLVFALCALPALAQNYQVKDANGNTLTMASKLNGGVNLPQHVLTDASGVNTQTVNAKGQAATVDAASVAQGSTTSGQSGLLVQCATTAAAPLNSMGATNPLSCDVNGNVRTVVGAPYTFTPLGCVQLSSLGSATGLTVPGGAVLASISVETAAIRYRDDGSNPTSAVGNPLSAGVQSWPYSGALGTIKFIQQSAGAVIDVCFYK